MTRTLHEQAAYPVTVICRVLEVARSTVYYEAKPKHEQALRGAIEALAGQFPTYGSRRMSKQLRRAPHEMLVNRKRAQRIMREMRLQGRVRRRKPRTTDSQHAYPRYPNLVKNVEAAYPDHIWVADITYVRLLWEWVYLAIVMDVYTRAIRGWHLSHSLEGELTLTALQGALVDRVPTIHHSDQGVQYAATDYVDLLQDHGVQISMTAQGKPEENGYAERLIRTIKEEEVYLSDYRDFEEAYIQVGHFIEDVYQTRRIHSALGYLTPVEFEAAWTRSRVEQMSSLMPG
jgi:transposase InsO family protein